jgi:hypothetical protein
LTNELGGVTLTPEMLYLPDDASGFSANHQTHSVRHLSAHADLHGGHHCLLVNE